MCCQFLQARLVTLGSGFMVSSPGFQPAGHTSSGFSCAQVSPANSQSNGLHTRSSLPQNTKAVAQRTAAVHSQSASTQL